MKHTHPRPLPRPVRYHSNGYLSVVAAVAIIGAFAIAYTAACMALAYGIVWVGVQLVTR